MARTNQIPRGTKFLGSTTLSRLENLYKKEGDARAKLRLLACIKRKHGHTFSEISDSLHVAPSTLSDWLSRIQRYGLDRRTNKKQEGRPCWLDTEQLGQLRKELMQDPQEFGFAQSMWSTKMVIAHVKKRYCTTYAARSMRSLLRKIGFSPKKPRPIHYKSASEPEKKQFKKKQQGQSGDTQDSDMHLSVWTSQRM